MASVDSLTADQQRVLLAKLLKQKSADSRIMPVSFAQRRLWFLDRLAPGQAYYNLPIVLRLKGDLDVEILQHFAPTLERLQGRGMLEVESDGVRLTRDGLFRVDSLLPEFYADRYQNSRYT